MKIGILAIQGAFLEHSNCLHACAKLQKIPLEVVEIRSKTDITSDIDGIILPGGESTAMGKLLNQDEFGDTLKAYICGTKPPVVWGTCSGLIMLANRLENEKIGGQYRIGGLDVTVSRNFFGRQVNSFEGSVVLNEGIFKEKTFHGVFIRAPAVSSVDSDKVKVLARLEVASGDIQQYVTVAVEQDNMLATSFHPELTEDFTWQKYFFDMIRKYRMQ